MIFPLLASMADVYNFNVDWRFKKLPMGIAGLPSARKAIAAEGKEFFDRTYPDSDWEMVSVPHAVNAHDSYDGPSVWWGEEKFFRGWMFYRKRFVPPKGRRFFLEFESVRSSVYLWVNGKYIGCYEAGIVASGYDITSALCEGENIVAVATENAAARAVKIYAAETSQGGEPGDWKGSVFQWDSTDYNPVQGGLTGNVNLHVKKNDSYFTLPLYETLRTSGTYVYAKDFDFRSGAATICVKPEIEGRGIVCMTVGGNVFTGETARVEGLRFWSPDTPHLYDVKVELLDESSLDVLDSITIRTGFRHVAYDRAKGGLLINGKNVWLPGYAQRSTDSWAAIGVAPDWMHDFEAELIRESNANFIRWMHVAPKPGPVRAFDKAGVVNLCPAGDTEKDAEGRQWEHRMDAMRAVITYFRNSPSILFWEAGNNRISPDHMRQMRLLKEELDPHGGRFMGCRTLTAPEEIAEAEYVGTML
ncbi:MAG: glycoside hydrolase family 2 protein, partial [Kiritimatiellae bacterium]|nr:glycoside hydrolase family 2 protein [Kiritimatiellia bacterium]